MGVSFPDSFARSAAASIRDDAGDSMVASVRPMLASPWIGSVAASAGRMAPSASTSAARPAVVSSACRPRTTPRSTPGSRMARRRPSKVERCAIGSARAAGTRARPMMRTISSRWSA
jgi:hypothetical protein